MPTIAASVTPCAAAVNATSDAAQTARHVMRGCMVGKDRESGRCSEHGCYGPRIRYATRCLSGIHRARCKWHPHCQFACLPLVRAHTPQTVGVSMLGPLENDSDVSRREFVLKTALVAGA